MDPQNALLSLQEKVIESRIVLVEHLGLISPNQTKRYLASSHVLLNAIQFYQVFFAKKFNTNVDETQGTVVEKHCEGKRFYN